VQIILKPPKPKPAVQPKPKPAVVQPKQDISITIEPAVQPKQDISITIEPAVEQPISHDSVKQDADYMRKQASVPDTVQSKSRSEVDAAEEFRRPATTKTQKVVDSSKASTSTTNSGV